MLALLPAVLGLLGAALYTPTQSAVTRDLLLGQGRTLLLTAHPDDEAFFFAPTLLALRDGGEEVYSLCVSVGDGDGHGPTRVGELGRALDALGVPEGRRRVLDEPGLKDDIEVLWPAPAVVDVVLPFVLEHNISTILTFDAHGISHHANHRALYAGTRALLASPRAPPHLRAYALHSVPLHSKYIGPLAALQAKLDVTMERHVNGARVPLPVFVSGVGAWRAALGAVLEHGSQMRWFRWLNVAFSRYLWVNEWVAVRPEAAAA